MRPIVALLLATSAVFAANMGENLHFTLVEEEMQTFNSVQEELKDDEVLKVQIFPMGRKNERPSPETPVWVYISARDDSHHWILPWRPGGGAPQQWLEVLLCHNAPTLELMVETNSSTPLPMRWSVSTENVKLGQRTRMKSTTADVSYRRFRWPDKDAVAADLEVSVIAGSNVCASLAVARRCVTHPHQLTDSHLLQRILFARGARFTVSRSDAPDGFWLYLITETDNSKCRVTAHRRVSNLPPPAKTIEVSLQTMTFMPSGASAAPRTDDQLPKGDLVLVAAGGDAGSWAGAPPPSQCEIQLNECRQQCPLG